MVKNLPAKQEKHIAWVQSLGWEDSLEKEMATHSSILAWEIPWTEEPGSLQSTESQRSDKTSNWVHACINNNVTNKSYFSVSLYDPKLNIVLSYVPLALSNKHRFPTFIKKMFFLM